MEDTDPKFAIISKMKRGDIRMGLAQFNQAENEAAKSLVQEIHDYNLDLCPKPEIPPDILVKLTGWTSIRDSEMVANQAGKSRHLNP
jgi:hypothetical protein